MGQLRILRAEIPDELGGLRLDRVLARIFPDYSRNKLQAWIVKGRVHVDGKRMRAKDRVYGGEWVEVDSEVEPILDCEPQAIPLDVVHEDASIIVINKPAGLVVHPAAGNPDGTLQNALLHHFPDLVSIPRAGMIHRIDKDTSGLIAVARTLPAHKLLVEQLQKREIQRNYIAVTNGRITAGGTINAPIGRHPVDRKRNTVTEYGKPSITHYRVAKRFSYHTLIRVRLETGRTHQIRVHMAHIRYPLLGDPVYGGNLKFPPSCPKPLAEQLKCFRRQALHAVKLGLVHPETNEFSEWEIPLPGDMEALLEALTLAETLIAPEGR